MPDQSLTVILLLLLSLSRVETSRLHRLLDASAITARLSKPLQLNSKHMEKGCSCKLSRQSWINFVTSSLGSVPCS